MRTYHLGYDFAPLGTLTIDDSVMAEDDIREMVDFCSGGEDWLDRYDGDYEKAFCHRLIFFLLREGRPPKDDEGLYPLDGSRGITLTGVTVWEPEEENFEIEEA